MPTYDYKCLKCGHTFELFQPMSADPIEKCPECNGKVKRLIGMGAGPIFKGSGFYQTDYKNKPLDKAKKDKTEAKSAPRENPKPSSVKKDK
jgi:putative FmdB family regulatory protein